VVFLLRTTLRRLLKSNLSSLTKGGSNATLFLRRYLNSDSALFLYDLDDSTLDFILALSFEELDKYVYALISRFYPNVQKESEQYVDLKNSYRASFAAEKLYRVNSLLNKNYTAIYTKTGLIREIVLDIYGIGNEKVVIN